MRELSTAAQTAKAIRKELKLAFPNIKFSVSSKNYSGGNSVDVCWVNGPTYDSVKKIVEKYQYGTVDGMTDGYNYDCVRKDIPQVKYTYSIREITEEVFEKYFEDYKKTHKNWDVYCVSLDHYDTDFFNEWKAVTPREYISRHLSKEDLTNFSQK